MSLPLDRSHHYFPDKPPELETGLGLTMLTYHHLGLRYALTERGSFQTITEDKQTLELTVEQADSFIRAVYATNLPELIDFMERNVH